MKTAWAASEIAIAQVRNRLLRRFLTEHRRRLVAPLKRLRDGFKSPCDEEIAFMNISRSAVAVFAVVGVLIASGCSTHSQIPSVASQPLSTSPGLIAPAPMARTAILPASVMLAATKKPDVAMEGASY